MSRNNHRRVNDRLHDYWHRLRGERDIPYEAEVDPDAIADIWASCFMVRVEHDPDLPGEKRYRYLFIGDDLIDAYGSGVQEQDVYATLMSTNRKDIVQQFRSVVVSGQEVMGDGAFINRNNVTIRYRSCMVPLLGPKENIEYILCGMKWRAF